MGIGIDVKGAGEAVGSVVSGVANLINTIKGTVSPDKQAELIAQAQALESTAMTAQAEVNKIEAASPNLFIAGARPAILWIGALVILYSYVIAPILQTLGAPVPDIQLGDLWPVITGILGLGTMRTYEKTQGVVNKH